MPLNVPANRVVVRSMPVPMNLAVWRWWSVADCVQSGNASACIDECATTTGATTFERTAATDMLVCGNAGNCFR